jgi:hypothetical protein
MTDTLTFPGWTPAASGWIHEPGWRPSEDNARAAYEVLDQIDAHPASWVQSVYWCGTGGCFAGWRAVLSGETPVLIDGFGFQLETGVHIADRAAQLLGFPDVYALDAYTDQRWAEEGEEDREDRPDWLFDSTNVRQDLGELVRLIFGLRPVPER